MRKVVVKRKETQRIGTAFLAALAYASGIACVAASGQIVTAVLFLPILLSATAMAIYYGAWQIVFSEKEITKRGLFSTRRYSYHQIQKVTAAYYSSESAEVVTVRFHDGRTIRFRGEDENGRRAISLIASRHSIERR